MKALHLPLKKEWHEMIERGEKTEVIDIQTVENGTIFIEYDDKGGEYYSVAEEDNQFKTLGEIIFDEITHSNLCSGKYRLTIKFEEL